MVEGGSRVAAGAPLGGILPPPRVCIVCQAVARAPLRQLYDGVVVGFGCRSQTQSHNYEICESSLMVGKRQATRGGIRAESSRFLLRCPRVASSGPVARAYPKVAVALVNL